MVKTLIANISKIASSEILCVFLKIVKRKEMKKKLKRIKMEIKEKGWNEKFKGNFLQLIFFPSFVKVQYENTMEWCLKIRAFIKKEK